MLKKLITLMLVLSIFSVQASASTNSGLKAAFDELNYSLSVEWDQKDKAFYQAEMKKFTDAVSALQTQGLTNAEMISFVKSEINDARVAKDVETAFNMISLNRMSASEATQYMLDTMKKSYSTGASWNGETATYLIGVALVVGFTVLLIAGANNSSSSTGGTYTPGSCIQTYMCGNSFCYNDALFGFTCQQNCYWTCF